MHPFVLALDLLGTFVFAISGATLGVRKRLDLFGVLVLSLAAAVSGGIARDVLIGATPPAALASWHYVAVSCAAGLAVFYRGTDIERLRNPVQLFDAIGLGLFAVTGAAKALAAGLNPVSAMLLGMLTGAAKALAAGLNPVSAMLLGMLTGIGGGIARDILAARIPVVLQADLYAVAALAGAAVVVAGDRFGWPQAPVLATGAVLVFVLRFLAIRRGWRLPVAPGGGDA